MSADHRTQSGRSSMKVVPTVSEMRLCSEAEKKAGKTIGLVPTMGKLHEGHLSLIRKAKEECDTIVVSLFVNPIQFSPNEDFRNYPRDFDKDKALAEKSGVDFLFCPVQDELYPSGFQTRIDLPGLADKLCGKSRPIHFSGVATVVMKLFQIVCPTKSYFGEKDYQQLLVIKRLVKDLDVNTEVTGCPIVRDSHGVALSSRNAYLTPQEKVSARSLNASLSLAQSLMDSGERNISVIKKKMRETICGKPHTHIEYISICDPETLEELDRIEDKALAALAVRLGKARLIDNRLLST